MRSKIIGAAVAALAFLLCSEPAQAGVKSATLDCTAQSGGPTVNRAGTLIVNRLDTTTEKVAELTNECRNANGLSRSAAKRIRPGTLVLINGVGYELLKGGTIWDAFKSFVTGDPVRGIKSPEADSSDLPEPPTLIKNARSPVPAISAVSIVPRAAQVSRVPGTEAQTPDSRPLMLFVLIGLFALALAAIATLIIGSIRTEKRMRGALPEGVPLTGPGSLAELLADKDAVIAAWKKENERLNASLREKERQARDADAMRDELRRNLSEARGTLTRLAAQIDCLEMRERERKPCPPLTLGRPMRFTFNVGVVKNAPDYPVTLTLRLEEPALTQLRKEDGGEFAIVIRAQGDWDSAVMNIGRRTHAGDTYWPSVLAALLSRSLDPATGKGMDGAAVRMRKYLAEHGIVLDPSILKTNAADVFARIEIAADEEEKRLAAAE